MRTTVELILDTKGMNTDITHAYFIIRSKYGSYCMWALRQDLYRNIR